MLKLPLLRSDIAYVAPEVGSDGRLGVWLGRRHLAVWWRGNGPWPEGRFHCPNGELWYLVERVQPVRPLFCWWRRQPPPSAVRLTGVYEPPEGWGKRFRLVLPVEPCPEAAEELRFDPGPTVAVLQAEPFYQAARRAILTRGGKQAQGVLFTIAPGSEGPVAHLETRDGAGESVPLAGELLVAEALLVPAALPRWLWWAGYRDDVYRLTRPPIGGWAAWWGDPAAGLVARAWVDDRGTVVQRRRRAAVSSAPRSTSSPRRPKGREDKG